MEKVVGSLHRRTLISLVYAIALQTVLIFAFSVWNVDFFHPLSWLSSVLSKFTSLTLWLYYFVFCALLAALSGIIKRRMLNEPPLFSSRFDMLKDLFRLNVLCELCLHVLISVVISCFYLNIFHGRYSDLYKTCAHTSGSCVVEGKVFMVYSATWSGIYIFLHNFFGCSYRPQFPVIQQLTFLRLKAELKPSLKYAMMKAFLPCVIYPFLYFWNGDIILHMVCDIFGLKVEEKLFSSFIDFLNFPLFFYTWLLTSVFIFTVKMMAHILNILLTDLPEFPITCRFGEENTGTLDEVIAARKYPVVQNWGCCDLYHVARNDHTRRQEIFALSQPGGHPKNWNAIKKECVLVIDTFVNDLNAAVTEMVNSQTKAAGSVPTPAPQRITREMSPIMRNLSIPGHEAMPFQYEQFNEQPLIVWHKVLEQVVTYFKKLLPPLLKKTGLCHVFDKFPDAKLKLAFSNCLPVINAAQGLAFLVAASLSEDAYGVVQKDLNGIIIALLQLKLTVDRALKQGNFKRAQRNDQHDVQMKAALKSALKRSLYKICVTFKDHIQELDLPPSTFNNLQPYLAFRE